jgi:hypothetical protein
MANWTQQLREAYYKLKESRAVSDDELQTLTPSGSAGGMAGAQRNIGRIRGVLDRINTKTLNPKPGDNSEKLKFDTQRAKHMLGSFGVDTSTRSSGVGLKTQAPSLAAKEGLPKDTTYAVQKDTPLRAGNPMVDQSDRQRHADTANQMMAQRRAQFSKE